MKKKPFKLSAAHIGKMKELKAMLLPHAPMKTMVDMLDQHITGNMGEPPVTGLDALRAKLRDEPQGGV